MIIEKESHPKHVTVWCSLWSGGIIKSFFIGNEAGNELFMKGTCDSHRFFVPQ